MTDISIDYSELLSTALSDADYAKYCATQSSDRINGVEDRIRDIQERIDNMERVLRYTQDACYDFNDLLTSLRQLREEAMEVSMSQDDFDSRLTKLLFGSN